MDLIQIYYYKRKGQSVKGRKCNAQYDSCSPALQLKEPITFFIEATPVCLVLNEQMHCLDQPELFSFSLLFFWSNCTAVDLLLNI